MSLPDCLAEVGKNLRNKVVDVASRSIVSLAGFKRGASASHYRRGQLAVLALGKRWPLQG